MRGDYPDPGHDIENFWAGATVALKFQLPSWDFKRTKKLTRPRHTHLKRLIRPPHSILAINLIYFSPSLDQNLSLHLGKSWLAVYLVVWVILGKIQCSINRWSAPNDQYHDCHQHIYPRSGPKKSLDQSGVCLSRAGHLQSLPMPNLGSYHERVCSGSEGFYPTVSQILGIVYIHAGCTRLTISPFATVSKLHESLQRYMSRYGVLFLFLFFFAGQTKDHQTSLSCWSPLDKDNSHLYGISSMKVSQILRVPLGNLPSIICT